MRVVDTTALYALFVAEDAHHQKARRAFADHEPVLVPAVVLAETLELLEYRFDHDVAVQAGKAIRGLPHVEWFAPSFDDQERTWSAFEEGLSYVDAAVVATCRHERAKPLSFDRRITRAVQR